MIKPIVFFMFGQYYLASWTKRNDDACCVGGIILC
jgi:hypothetical protein